MKNGAARLNGDSKLGNVEDRLFCLDTMPFGTFLEIEGPKESIKDAARQMNLDWKDRILANYLSIFEALRNRFGLPFNDVTFAEFERHPVDLGPLLPTLQAGGRHIETVENNQGTK